MLDFTIICIKFRTICAQHFIGIFRARILLPLSDWCSEIPDSNDEEMVHLHYKDGLWLHHNGLVSIPVYQNMRMI